MIKIQYKFIFVLCSGLNCLNLQATTAYEAGQLVREKIQLEQQNEEQRRVETEKQQLWPERFPPPPPPDSYLMQQLQLQIQQQQLEIERLKMQKNCPQ